MSSNLAYQDDFAAKRREELVDGKTVMMSPRPSVNHSQVASNIYYLFAHYLRKKTCRPFADGVDLYLDEDNQFIPDFMVVCDPDKIKPDGVHGAPDLVVEVLSPSTARNDVHALYPDWQLAQMSEDERAAVVTHFKCSLFDDLDISLEDIFYRTF